MGAKSISFPRTRLLSAHLRSHPAVLKPPLALAREEASSSRHGPWRLGRGLGGATEGCSGDQNPRHSLSIYSNHIIRKPIPSTKRRNIPHLYSISVNK